MSVSNTKKEQLKKKQKKKQDNTMTISLFKHFNIHYTGSL